MKKLYLYFTALLSTGLYSQSILNQAETGSRTVSDPQAVVLAQGFSASSNVSNPFIAKIGASSENNPTNPTNSNAGSTNPAGTTAPTGMSFHDTQGNIDVNGGGQLQYTLPIALPPGVKSVAPQINLIYNSGSGNGIAGYGWNLSGITSISRVGKNIEKDNEIKALQLDYSDYYSFNGQRLILKSGEYGKDGAEYVTEKYSNIKIKSVGATQSATKGPMYFQVTFEDGSQAWYGDIQSDDPEFNSANARTSLEYNIVKWMDAQGNYISYNYEVTTGQMQGLVSRIATIAWGGNETLNKPHFNSIVFTYKARNTIEESFLNGYKFVQNQILNYITVYANNNIFKKYNIDYEINTAVSKLEYVKKITESNSNLQAANAVEFSYPTIDYIAQRQNLSANLISENQKFGDFDGDGRIDLLYYDVGTAGYYECLEYDDYGYCNQQGNYIEPTAGGTYVVFNKFDGNFSPTRVSNENLTNGIIVGGILDANGKISAGQGLIMKEEIKNVSPQKLVLKMYTLENNTFVLARTKEILRSKYDNTFKYPPNPGPFEPYSESVTSLGGFKDIDIDGDSTSELIFSAQDYYCVHDVFPPDNIINNGSSSANKNAPENWDVRCNYQYRNYVIDLKDSSTDISPVYFGSKDINDYDILDFDGDGKSDIVERKDTTLEIKQDFKKNSSNAYQSNKQLYILYNGEKAGLSYGDFNGDGKTDFIVPEKGVDDTTNWRLYTNNGNAFIETYYSNLFPYRKDPDISNSGRKRYKIKTNFSKDINGDGKDDLIFIESQTFKKHDIGSNRDSSFEIRTKINEGVDASGRITFRDSYTENFESTDDNHFIPINISAKVYNVDRFIMVKHGNTNFFAYNFINVPEKYTINKIKQGEIYTDIIYNSIDAGNSNTSDFYRVSAGLQYPYATLKNIPSKSVVVRLQQNNRKQDFKYRDLSIHFQGRGALGFRQTARSSWYANSDGLENTAIWSGAEIDPLNESVPIKEWSVKTYNDNNLIFPTDISENNNQLLSYKKTDYSTDLLANGVKAILPWKSLTKDFLTNITTDAQIFYGSYYLPEKTTTSINGGYGTTQTLMSYTHNPLGIGKDYYIGRAESKTEVITAYGNTKSAEEYYEYDNNLLSALIKKPYSTQTSLNELYQYDGWGNIIEKRILYKIPKSTTPPSLIQIEKAQYDDKGRFAIKKTDNLELSTNITYNDWGQILTQTDPFGVILTNTYDGWGKLLTSKTNLEGQTTYVYNKYADGGSVVIQHDPNGNISKKYTNKLGQDYKTQTKAFGQNNYVAKYKLYDAIGRQIKESEPYFDTATEELPSNIKWNEIKYDDTVYPSKVTAISFNGKKLETTFSGRTTSVRELNGNMRITTKTTDALGNVITSTDKGGTINFGYNAAGQQISAQYGTNTVTMGYDDWGRKIEFNDPSNGKYSYGYDGLGRIVSEKSPKGIKEYGYNNFGQLSVQEEHSEDGISTNKSIIYSYNAKGLITSKQGTANGKAFSSIVSYDDYGRVISSSENSNGKYFMKKGVTYDDKMRVTSYEKSLYSSGQYTKVVIENVYDSWNGELYQVKDKNQNKVLWELQSTQANGQVLNAKLGGTTITNQYDSNNFLYTMHYKNVSNNATVLQMTYSFDALKNELKYRTRGGDFNITENFDYDDNNRLENWTDPVTGIKPQTIRNTYDIKGRIINNDQVGEFKFDNTNKIYQPSRMILNAEGQQNFNENLLQKITYNENNDPIFIDGMKGDVSFTYGLTNMRQMATYGGNFDKNGTGKFTKYYSEDGSYEVVRNNQTGQEKHILYIGGTPYESNILYLKDYTESSGSYKFLHKDYLGSILAISDEAGNTLEQRHYDAWGQFTHLKVGSQSMIVGVQQVTDYLASNNLLLDRGYTSHEHFSEVGLIHMNGRLYDPLLKRFLNADENIQDMFNTQNYNKYGYVLNNPLMYNDPNGEFIWFLAAAWAASHIFAATVITGAVIGAALGAGMYMIQAALSGKWNWGGFAKSILFGAVSGAAGGAVGTLFTAGSLMASAMAGMAGGVSQGILNTFVNGASANGIWQGAITGFLGGAAGTIGGGTFGENMAWGTGTGALVGGVSSSLSGGNFWQGAITGAITGAAFATITSGIEMVRNYRDGYGFKTNSGVVNNLVNQANAGGKIDAVAAQKAIDFAQKRYGLGNMSMEYDSTLDDWGSTNVDTGNIRIGDSAFSSASMFKATISHEYYHSANDRNYDMKTGKYSWKGTRRFNPDGQIGYEGEIKLAGKLHTGWSALGAKVKGEALNQIWTNKSFFNKIFSTIPSRF